LSGVGVVEGAVLCGGGVTVDRRSVGPLRVNGDSACRRQHPDEVPVAHAATTGQGLSVTGRRTQQIADDEVLQLLPKGGGSRCERRRVIGHGVQVTECL
jgi:hypothetical protein